MELIINRKDPSKRGLLAQIGGRLVASTARLDRLIRNDGEPLTIRVADPSDAGAVEFTEVDISTASVRAAMGLPDQVPDKGTAFFQVGSDVTAAVAIDDAAAIETALNLLPGVIAQGGVTVEIPGPGLVQVTWNEAGTQGSIPATLLRSTTPRIYPMPLVTGYTGGGATKADGTATIGAALNSLFVFVIGGVMDVCRLEAGTAITNIDVGVIRTTDYDPVLNAVNLVRVEGL
jgi:hypothetical protein